LSERVLAGVPLPASGCRVSSSYRAIILDGNLCDHSTSLDNAAGDNGCSPSNLTLDSGLAALVSEALNHLSLFTGPNKRRGQQIMDQGLIIHVGRGRAVDSDSKFDALDEGREFSAIRYGINQSRLKATNLSCKTLYRQRHKVENMFARLKDWRIVTEELVELYRQALPQEQAPRFFLILLSRGNKETTAKSLIVLVTPTGFEPVTSRLGI
jgi:hypothetical protein